MFTDSVVNIIKDDVIGTIKSIIGENYLYTNSCPNVGFFHYVKNEKSANIIIEYLQKVDILSKSMFGIFMYNKIYFLKKDDNKYEVSCYLTSECLNNFNKNDVIYN
jgi:hypothetical protein